MGLLCYARPTVHFASSIARSRAQCYTQHVWDLDGLACYNRSTYTPRLLLTNECIRSTWTEVSLLAQSCCLARQTPTETYAMLLKEGLAHGCFTQTFSLKLEFTVCFNYTHSNANTSALLVCKYRLVFA